MSFGKYCFLGFNLTAYWNCIFCIQQQIKYLINDVKSNQTAHWIQQIIRLHIFIFHIGPFPILINLSFQSSFKNITISDKNMCHFENILSFKNEGFNMTHWRRPIRRFVRWPTGTLKITNTSLIFDIFDSAYLGRTKEVRGKGDQIFRISHRSNYCIDHTVCGKVLLPLSLGSGIHPLEVGSRFNL